MDANKIMNTLQLKDSLSLGNNRKRIGEFIASSPEVKRLLKDLNRDETFHILLHSHYDPAWFAKRSITKEMLASFYKKVMALLDSDPDYKFTADSQTQVVEDFLSNLKGEEKLIAQEKLSKYISEGRLIVGPYYAGIDLNLSSGVVLRRNILYGMSDTRALGWKGPHTGWMIDQFGFPAQTWQLHKRFGIDGIILWRGLGLKPDEAKAEILLESPDGSRLLGKWLFVQGYRFGLYMGKYSDIGVPRLIQESKKIREYTKSRHLLIMDGYEGESSPDNPEEVMKMMRSIHGKVRISTPRIFISELLNELDEKDLPVVRGYQNYGYYSPVLKGVISSRQYIKQAHQLCDDTFTKVMDPAAVLAETFRIGQDWKAIEQLWRQLIRMASHDELGGCGIDDIHRESFDVYRDIYKKALSLTDRNIEEIALNIHSDIPVFIDEEQKTAVKTCVPITVFNTLSFDRSDVVQVTAHIPSDWDSVAVYDENGTNYAIQVLDTHEDSNTGERAMDFLMLLAEESKLPSFGYKTFFITDSKGRRDKDRNEVICGRNWIDNGLVRVDINEDGTFNLIYKKTGRTYRNLGYLRVEPDRGDTYDFSHIEHDDVITSLAGNATIKKEFCGNLETRFRIDYTLMVPSRITDDRTTWEDERVPLNITVILTVQIGSERVDIGMFVNNRLRDSRIRVCFPVETETDTIFVNRQFDVYKRPLHISDLSVKEKEEIFKHMDGMISSGMDIVEVKTDINFKWIDIPVNGEQDAQITEGIGLLNRDNFEFEIRNEKESEKIVELTLLRSVGWNARGDLLTRNINAGWEIYTPDAYCYGEYYFPLSILPHDGDWKEGRLFEESEKRTTEPKIVEIPRQTGKLPTSFSLFSVETKAVVVSEITKDARDDKKIVIVLYNPDEETGDINFTYSVNLKSVSIVHLDGTRIKDVALRDKTEFSVSLGKKEILELTVELEDDLPYRVDTSISSRLEKNAAEVTDKQSSLEDSLKLRMAPAVDQQEVLREKQRWLKCKRLYRSMLLKQENGAAAEDLDGFIEKFGKDENLINLENTVKEAHYSYLLTLKRYYETQGKRRSASRVEKSIAKMGRELIDLRVKKREAEIYRVFFENLKALN